MNILIFTHENSGEAGLSLVKGVTSCHLSQKLRKVGSTAELELHLKTSGENRGREILILLAENRDRLEELIRLSALLEDRRLILVVPDEAHATLSAAHRLFPRFVTPIADRYDDLCSVICRMMDRACAVNTPRAIMKT